jgi:gluconate 2-dehydrogenase gamma chain
MQRATSRTRHVTGSRLNRRDLLSAGIAAGTSVALSGPPADARTISGEVPWTPGDANRPTAATGDAYEFLTREEAAFVEAAVSRLIPADDLGPGAREAGAVFFIDRQLKGPFGAAQSWYMQGPWPHGEETQGFQSRMTPAQLYRTAIKEIDDHCRASYGGKTFSALAAEQQDQVLAGLEKDDVKLATVMSHVFFEMFLQNTIEGFFSDPIHGGNRDMIGWKLIGFPGARYDYRPYVRQHNQRLSLAPVGITGRPGWDPAKS